MFLGSSCCNIAENSTFARPLDFACRLNPSFHAFAEACATETLGTYDYLIRFRLQRGLSLLAETSLPVAEIADRVGISQSNYFSRLVRRTVGMTPSEYRLARNL